MNLNIITAEDASRARTAVTGDPFEDVERAAEPAVAGGAQLTADDVYSRILKYIPAPLIGLYLMVQNLVVGGAKPNETLAWIVFAVFAALVAVYLVAREVRRPEQIVLSVLVFSAWAAASPGPFQLISGWEGYYGTVALAIALAVLVSFRIKPLPAAAAQS